MSGFTVVGRPPFGAVVTLNDGGTKMTISGPFGTKVIIADQPAEIGLAVIETLTGDMVAPPRAYRKEGQ